MTLALQNKKQLTTRWYPLKTHKERLGFFNSAARFNVSHSGRRSGKTEYAKRRGVLKGLRFHKFPDGWIVFAAPTREQAKRIFWRDLKLMVPKKFVYGRANETELSLRLVNGVLFQVVGLDRPYRVEGVPLDHIVVDEIADADPDAWEENIRPMLSNVGRPGTADLIGVPNGRNHWFEMAENAKDPDWLEWSSWHWLSEDILDPGEIAELKRTMDARTYDQEYRGSFIMFEGRAYYTFDADVHTNQRLKYDARYDLIFCLDFNVSPGVAAVCQEQEKLRYKWGASRTDIADVFTAGVGEVFIPKDSNTPMVCRKLAEDWQHHKGDVIVHGDATGGARKSSQTEGTDWDLVESILRKTFGNRVKMYQPQSNPLQKVRLNAVNSRFRTTDEKIHCMVDKKACKYLVRDLEGVQVKKGTAGEIDKDKKSKLTHISDAIGYYLAEEHPIEVEGVEYKQEDII